MTYILNLLKQVSTWQGIIKLVASSGLISIAPEIGDNLAHAIVQIISAVLAIAGAVDLIRNEKSTDGKKGQSGFVGLLTMAALFTVGIFGSGLVKIKDKRPVLDKAVLHAGKPVDYSKLND